MRIVLSFFTLSFFAFSLQSAHSEFKNIFTDALYDGLEDVDDDNRLNELYQRKCRIVREKVTGDQIQQFSDICEEAKNASGYANLAGVGFVGASAVGMFFSAGTSLTITAGGYGIVKKYMNRSSELYRESRRIGDRVIDIQNAITEGDIWQLENYFVSNICQLSPIMRQKIKSALITAYDHRLTEGAQKYLLLMTAFPNQVLGPKSSANDEAFMLEQEVQSLLFGLFCSAQGLSDGAKSAVLNIFEQIFERNYDRACGVEDLKRQSFYLYGNGLNELDNVKKVFKIFSLMTAPMSDENPSASLNQGLISVSANDFPELTDEDVYGSFQNETGFLLNAIYFAKKGEYHLDPIIFIYNFDQWIQGKNIPKLHFLFDGEKPTFKCGFFDDVEVDFANVTFICVGESNPNNWTEQFHALRDRLIKYKCEI